MDEAEKTRLITFKRWLCWPSVKFGCVCDQFLRENCVWSEMTMEIYFYSVDDC